MPGVNVTCPHCGRKNYLELPEGYNVVTCTESGLVGCNSSFVVEVIIHTRTKYEVYKLVPVDSKADATS